MAKRKKKEIKFKGSSALYSTESQGDYNSIREALSIVALFQPRPAEYVMAGAKTVIRCTKNKAEYLIRIKTGRRGKIENDLRKLLLEVPEKPLHHRKGEHFF